MAIAWPSALQQKPLVDRFHIQRVDNRIQSPTETGPGKMRRGQTHTVRMVPVSIVCDNADRAVLEAFLDSTTQGGVLRFGWTDLDTIIMGTHEYQFAKDGLPDYQPYGCDWKAVFTLKVW